REGTKLTLILEDVKGNEVGTVTEDVSDFNGTLTLSVSDVNLWSAEDPYLYRAFLKILDASSQLVEVVPQQVGFRLFEMKYNIMHINGERFVFRGFYSDKFLTYNCRVYTHDDKMEDHRL